VIATAGAGVCGPGVSRRKEQVMAAGQAGGGQRGIFLADQDGLHEIERIAGKIGKQEQAPKLAAPGGLAYCRRVTEETRDPRQWQVAKHRCPCGSATSDAGAFNEHLGGTDGRAPEHFEVAGGRALQQVAAGQTATAGSP